MENTILDNLQIFNDIDDESISKVIEALENEMEYQAKYGIVPKDVKLSGDDLLEYWIIVPEKSDLKSDSNFNMEGIYLAKQFKSLLINNFKNLGLSKIRVRVHYTSLDTSLWTEDDSKKSIEEYNNTVKADISARFNGHLKLSKEET